MLKNRHFLAGGGNATLSDIRILVVASYIHVHTKGSARSISNSNPNLLKNSAKKKTRMTPLATTC